MSDSMIPAETIRRAAALMRERAEMATCDGLSSPPWRIGQAASCECCEQVIDAAGSLVTTVDDRQSAHIAGMHPGTGLAVAAWLESSSDDAGDAVPGGDGTWIYSACDSPAGVQEALKVARAYLGEADPA